MYPSCCDLPPALLLPIRPRRWATAILTILLLAGCSGADDAASEPGAGVGAGGTTAGGGTTPGGTTTGGGTTPGGTTTGGGTMPGGGGAGSGGPSESGGAGGGGTVPGGTVPCDESYALGGYAGCVSTLRGHRTKFLPLPSGHKPKAIGVYFHGDTAVDWDNDSFDWLARWAYEHDVLFLAPRSEAWASNPGEDPWRAWYQTDEAGSLVVANILEDFVASYGRPTGPYLYTGVSGGSIFLTDNYMAYAMEKHPGVVVANCGAANPSLMPSFDWPTRRSDLLPRVPVHFHYGTADFLAEQIGDAITYYQGRGFTVTKRTIQGAGHCAIDSEGFTETTWASYL